MSDRFKPGQLVTPMDWCDEPLELYAEPRAAYGGPVNIRVIGKLYPHDVALVVYVDSRLTLYLVGSHGNGWTPSGFIQVVQGT